MLGLGLDLTYKMGGVIQSVNTLNTGLIAFWELDETSGTRYDSHASYDLIEGGSSVGYNTGIINNAASISYNFLDSNNHFNLATNGFSVSTWLNGNQAYIGPAVSQWIFGFGFIIGIDSTFFGNDEIVFTLGDTSFYSAKHPNSSGWHHVVAIYDSNAGTSKLYVDGILRQQINDIPTIALNSGASFKLGSIDYGDNDFYDGLIDSTGLWSRSLNEQEVIALYNNGNGLQYEQF